MKRFIEWINKPYKGIIGIPLYLQVAIVCLSQKFFLCGIFALWAFFNTIIDGYSYVTKNDEKDGK